MKVIKIECGKSRQRIESFFAFQFDRQGDNHRCSTKKISFQSINWFSLSNLRFFAKNNSSSTSLSNDIDYHILPVLRDPCESPFLPKRRKIKSTTALPCAFSKRNECSDDRCIANQSNKSTNEVISHQWKQRGRENLSHPCYSNSKRNEMEVQVEEEKLNRIESNRIGAMTMVIENFLYLVGMVDACTPSLLNDLQLTHWISLTHP